MTSRFAFPVRCPCGHLGSIVMRENDAPGSEPWESYTPRDLNGTGFETTRADWSEVYVRMGLSCPACGLELTQANTKSE
jgi:hypothetical protein